MKTYLVGGAVRDALLGRGVKDRDWCVVGASPQEMQDIGYLSVGKDFPVFLHPQTREEYALARTERKTAPGYHGFAFHAAPEVTIEEDLARRDITINSIAVPAHFVVDLEHFDIKKRPLEVLKSSLIDPFGGLNDIKAKILRHTSPAFAEDPVRILRIARFAARYADFSIAHETLQLMKHMVNEGEVNALVPERVWQEIAKGLMEDKPSRMFEALRNCGALKVLLPELNRLWGVPQPALHHPEIDTGIHVMMVIDMAAQLKAALAVRFACLVHDLGKGTTPVAILPKHHGHEQRSVALLLDICKRLRVPTDCKEIAQIVALEHGNIHRSGQLFEVKNAKAIYRLLKRCDALRRPDRFAQILLACECDARGRLGLQTQEYLPAVQLKEALQAMQSIDLTAIMNFAQARGSEGLANGQNMRQKMSQEIGQAIEQARMSAIFK